MRALLIIGCSLLVANAVVAQQPSGPSFTKPAPPLPKSDPKDWSKQSQTTSTGDRARTDDSYTKQISKSGARAGVGATTTYEKPGIGADGPVPGSQTGSQSNTSAGAVLTIPFPEKKK